MEQYDVIVIGGGPGGYSAAVRASQLGMKTALVEKEHLGGTCLNWGCIPTKSLLRNAEIVHLLARGKAWGVSCDTLAVDYGAAYKRSRDVVTRQTRRIAILMKNHRVTVFSGTGRLRNAREVVIDESGQTLAAGNIIVATGSQPRALPGLACDGDRVISFRQALAQTRVPASALIIGAGPIGMEFATLWSRYGAKVTVIELLPRVLPLEDEEISLEAAKQFKRNGIVLRTGATTRNFETTADGVTVTLSGAEGVEQITVEKVLVAIGFAAHTDGLGLETAGVALERGNIVVDERMRASVPGIYAIGDVTGKMCLAHVASAQAMIAAETIAGRDTQSLVYANVPRCTYAHPEIASVGLTEKQCRDQGLEIKTAQCPFVANGKALALDDNAGFVKLIAAAGTGKLLGVHLIGGHVTELIAGPASLLSLGADAAQLGASIHPHPTLSEAIMEAAHALCGHAIHI